MNGRRQRRVPLVRRQLLARPGRALAGALGIGAALLLVLALNAIFAGIEERLTAYIDGSGADVIVAQEGVATMHMTQSALTAEAAERVAAVPGVAGVNPVAYVPATVARTDRRGLVYLIGDDRGGRPFPLASGSRPRAGEIVVDRVLAEQLDVPVGGRVEVLGRTLRVAGEVSGLATITNSFAFTTRAQLSSLLGSRDTIGYLLVGGNPGEDAGSLARRISNDVPGVSAWTRAAFSSSEQRVVGDMSTDIVRGMLLVGFVIGLAVAGLVAYAQTLAQLRDYGVLRAVGMRARDAVAVVAGQVGVLVAGGFLAAVLADLLLAALMPSLSSTLAPAVRVDDVVGVAAVAFAVALAAALVPLARVVRVDPASVFRSGG